MQIKGDYGHPPYDVIVIGAGPAGLTAATDIARAGLKALCLDKLAPGGEIMNLGELHDFEEIFDGTTMASRLTDDAVVAGVEIGFGEVSSISGSGPFEVETADGERHAARSLVVATGLDKGKLGVAGEDEYEGRGLSHCANCDGPLYAGQPVIIAGVRCHSTPSSASFPSASTSRSATSSPAPPAGHPTRQRLSSASPARSSCSALPTATSPRE